MNESSEKPFFREVGRFRLSKGEKAINIHLNGGYYSIPITELESVVDKTQITGIVREYLSTDEV